MRFAGRGAGLIKLDIINEVVNRTGITKTKAEMAVETVFESMKRAGSAAANALSFAVDGSLVSSTTGQDRRRNRGIRRWIGHDEPSFERPGNPHLNGGGHRWCVQYAIQPSAGMRLCPARPSGSQAPLFTGATARLPWPIYQVNFVVPVPPSGTPPCVTIDPSQLPQQYVTVLLTLPSTVRII